MTQARLAFIAAAAHDLINPLSGLTLWMDTLDTLKPRLASGADAQAAALLEDALQQMHGQVRRAVYRLDDVLDAIRLDANRPLPYAPADVDLACVVHQALHSQPDNGDHPLRLESTASELRGWWDADRLGRLVENLLANAIKYSPPGRPITVRVRQEDGDGVRWAVLEVEDRGMGIPAAELPRILEPFHRARNVKWTTDGNGLGLWGCRTIAEQHGGTLTLASREGEGTTVTVRLPLTQPVAPHPDRRAAVTAGYTDENSDDR